MTKSTVEFCFLSTFITVVLVILSQLPTLTVDLKVMELRQDPTDGSLCFSNRAKNLIKPTFGSGSVSMTFKSTVEVCFLSTFITVVLVVLSQLPTSTVDLKVIETLPEPKVDFIKFFALFEKHNDPSFGSWRNSMTFKSTVEVGKLAQIHLFHCET